MKAMQFDAPGPPEALHLVDAPKPEAAPGEVLVAIAAIGVNFAEAGRRRGTFPLPHGQSLPHIPGYECAGVVEAVGDGVEGFAPGDRVLTRGYAHTYAEYAAVADSAVYHIPPELSFESAAAISGMYSTAWQNVVNRGNVQPGETVLVQACASGVGIANVQVAKHRGATVIGTASSDEKLAWAATLGVDHAINYETHDFVEEAKRLTDGKGVPVIIDGVGGETFLKGLKALAPGGRIVVYGVAGGQRQVAVTIPELWFTNLTVLGSGSSGVSREDFQRVIGLVADGTLQTPIDRTWPLEQAAEAHRYLEERRVRGKLVLTVG